MHETEMISLYTSYFQTIAGAVYQNMTQSFMCWNGISLTQWQEFNSWNR